MAVTSLPSTEPELACGLGGDRRDEPDAAGIELDVRGRLTVHDAGDRAGIWFRALSFMAASIARRPPRLE